MNDSTDATRQLWPEIRSIIENGIRSQPRSLQKEIGPSELGTPCVHCLAARLADWPHAHTPAGWIPFIGTSVHAQFETMFRNIRDPWDPGDETPRFLTEHRVTVGRISGVYGGYDVTGSIDLWDRKTHATIDWKIVGSNRLGEVRAHGPSQQYRIQASLYGIGLLNEGEHVERSCIYFLPRNKSSLTDAVPVEWEFDPKPGQWALARANTLATFLDLIEASDGPDTRDQWISLLPADPRHCFQCGTWPDDQLGDLQAINRNGEHPTPDKWERLTSLIQSEYPNPDNNK